MHFRGTVIGLVVVWALSPLAASAVSITVWNEDFSNVSDWFKIADDQGGSTLTSDGNLGDFYSPQGGNSAAFGPKTDGFSALLRFDPTAAAAYSIHFTVDNIGWSVSYDVSLDVFGATTNHLQTVWNVFPAMSYSTFVGYTNVALGAFSFNPNGVYMIPKITIHTGNGEQHVYFDEMHFEQELIPEPATAAVFAAGIVVLFLNRKRLARRP